MGERCIHRRYPLSLAEHKVAGTMPALLWAHDPGQPIGVWTHAAEDVKGLAVRGRLALDVPRAVEARALAKAGALGLSIGYRVRDSGYENGRRVLKNIQLFEISMVAMPSNTDARFSIKSAIEAGDVTVTPRLIERILHDAGLPKAFCRKLVAGGWTAANTLVDVEDAGGRELIEAVKAQTALLERLKNGHR
jgi:HK97 family phage prohead protease